MKIFLVRHGQDQDNVNKILNGHRDETLTDLGREQALAAAEKLVGKEITKIFSSPLKRTRETAQIIADHLGIGEVIVDRDLIERDFGVLTGQPLADITKLSTDVLHWDGVDYFLTGEGVEGFDSVYERSKNFLERIASETGNVVVVSHGDTGKILRAAYYNWDWERGLKQPYFANTEIMELSKDA